MKEGDVELAMLPQTDGSLKRRPVVVLREMRPFRDWLVSVLPSLQLLHLLRRSCVT